LLLNNNRHYNGGLKPLSKIICLQLRPTLYVIPYITPPYFEGVPPTLRKTSFLKRAPYLNPVIPLSAPHEKNKGRFLFSLGAKIWRKSFVPSNREGKV